MTPSSGNGGGAETSGRGLEANGERFPRRARVSRGREIRRTLREGRRVRANGVDLFVVSSPRGRARVGVVVPRHGRTAVARNRLLRRLRELARREWLPMARRARADLDLILHARPAAYELSFEALRQTLLDAFRDCLEA